MDPYLRDVLDVLPPDAPRDRRHRLDRRVLLLRPARPRAPRRRSDRRTPTPGSRASSGACTAAASTTRRSTASRRPRCPSRCTGSSGRRTRRGSRASRSSSSSTTSTPTCGSSTRRSPTSTPWQAIALSVGGIALAWIVYDVLCRTVGRAKPGRARRRRHGARRARGLGRRRALRAARRLPPGRRDARDDHGRERPLRDHPGAPEARGGDGGEARAGSRAAAPREEPLGPQQLPHAPRALHDARRALRVRVRRGRSVARLRR